MTRNSLFAAALAASAALVAHAQLTPAQRLAKWKPVEMPYHFGSLSVKERQMVDRLVDASRLLNQIYWRQSDLTGFKLYQSTADRTLKQLLAIMGRPLGPDRRESPVHRHRAHAARATNCIRTTSRARRSSSTSTSIPRTRPRFTIPSRW